MTTFADLVPSPAGRFDGIERPYSPEDVLRLRGSVPVTHTLAERGANVVVNDIGSDPEQRHYPGAASAEVNDQNRIVSDGLEVVAVGTFEEALEATTTIAETGTVEGLPTCEDVTP